MLFTVAYFFTFNALYDIYRERKREIAKNVREHIADTFFLKKTVKLLFFVFLVFLRYISRKLFQDIYIYKRERERVSTREKERYA